MFVKTYNAERNVVEFVRTEFYESIASPPTLPPHTYLYFLNLFDTAE